jgi:hypothetical protein
MAMVPWRLMAIAMPVGKDLVTVVVVTEQLL